MAKASKPPVITSHALDGDLLTLDGTAPANTTILLYSGTTLLGAATANSAGLWDVTIGAPLASGTYGIAATDSALSHTSALSAPFNVTIDLSSPDNSVLSALTTSIAATPISAATAGAAAIPTTYFGMTIASPNYNYGFYGGPVEAWPTIPTTVARSWDVWSPGNGQIAHISWADLNPSAGVYNFAALDAWIATCKANGTQMVYTFGDAPAWAGGSTPNAAAFQSFVTAIVTHCAGQISYWEGFNEYTSSLSVTTAQMVSLQQILYQTAKSIDPASLVLSPTVSDTSEQSFAQFLSAGGGAYFDIAALHGYNDLTGEEIITPVTNFESVLNAAGLGSKPVWDTEWGMWPGISGTNAQEAFLSVSLVLQWALGVKTEIFYGYDTSSFGIYDTTTGQLTPGGVAYEKTVHWLTGATEPSGYQLNGSVYTVQLVRNSESDLVVWNSAGQSSYSAGSYTQYVDVQGQVHSITNGVVTIGNTPILLESPAGSTSIVPQIISPPQITSFSPDSGVIGDGITNSTNVTLKGAASANTNVTVYDGATQLGTAIADGSGAWSFSTAALSNGSHSFVATDTNTSGNTSGDSAVLNIMVDTIAPTPTFTNVAISRSGATLSGTSDANSTVAIFDGSNQTALGTVTTNANGTWSLAISSPSNAIHDFTASAIDAAGNIGSSSNMVIYGSTGNDIIQVLQNSIVTGRGGSDTFVFGAAPGQATITDFTVTGSHHDFLQFDHNTFANVTAVLGRAAQVGSNVVITEDASDSVTLVGVKLSALTSADFHFV